MRFPARARLVIGTGTGLFSMSLLVCFTSPAASQNGDVIAACTHSQLGLLNVPAMTFSNSLQPASAVLPIAIKPNTTYWAQAVAPPFGMTPFPSPTPNGGTVPPAPTAQTATPMPSPQATAPSFVLYRIEPTTGAIRNVNFAVTLPDGTSTTDRSSGEGCRAIAIVLPTPPSSSATVILDYSLKVPTAQELAQSVNRFADISIPWGMSQPRSSSASLPLSRTSGDLAAAFGPFAMKLTFGQDGFDIVQKRLSLGGAPSDGSSVSSGGGGGRARGRRKGTQTPPPDSTSATATATPPASPDTSGFQNTASTCYGCYDFRSEDTALFQPLSTAQTTIGGLQAQQFGLGRYIFDPTTANFPYDRSGEIVYGRPDGSITAGLRLFSGTVPQATPSPGATPTSAPLGAAVQANASPYIHSSLVTAFQYANSANTFQLGVTSTSTMLGSGFDPTATSMTAQHAWNVTAIAKLSGELSAFLQLSRVYGSLVASKVFSDNDRSSLNRVVALSYTAPNSRANAASANSSAPNPCAQAAREPFSLSAGWHDVGGAFVPYDGTATYRYYGLKGPTAGLTVNVLPDVSLTAQATYGFDRTAFRMSDSVATVQSTCRWSRSTESGKSRPGVTYISLTPAISYENTGSDAGIWGRTQFNNVTQPSDLALRGTWIAQVQMHPTITVDALIGDRDQLRIADPTSEVKLTIGKYLGSTSVQCSAVGGPANCVSNPIQSPSLTIGYSNPVLALNAGFNNTDQPPGSNDAPRFQQQSYSVLATVLPRACVTAGISAVKYVNSAQNPNGVTWLASLDIPFLNARWGYDKAVVPDLLIEYSASPSQPTGSATALTGNQSAPYVYARMRLGGGKRYNPGRCGPI